MKEKKESLNRDYEEFKVSPVYESIIDQLGKTIGRKLTGYNKESLAPIRTTRITPDKAETLNEQSENSGFRLYEIER